MIKGLAYRDGQIAFQCRTLVNECPYNQNTYEYAEWRRGWFDDAKKETERLIIEQKR